MPRAARRRSPFWAHPTAVIYRPATIGAGTRIWHFVHVMTGATIDAGCVLGQNAFAAGGAAIGDRCRIQNNVSLYDGVVLGDDVFVGPSAVFTNVVNPRAFIARKGEYRRTIVEAGATIGANATIICGHRLGACCLVAAGAVVTSDVAPVRARRRRPRPPDRLDLPVRHDPAARTGSPPDLPGLPDPLRAVRPRRAAAARARERPFNAGPPTPAIVMVALGEMLGQARVAPKPHPHASIEMPSDWKL